MTRRSRRSITPRSRRGARRSRALSPDGSPTGTDVVLVGERGNTSNNPSVCGCSEYHPASAKALVLALIPLSDNRMQFLSRIQISPAKNTNDFCLNAMGQGSRSIPSIVAGATLLDYELLVLTSHAKLKTSQRIVLQRITRLLSTIGEIHCPLAQFIVCGADPDQAVTFCLECQNI